MTAPLRSACSTTPSLSMTSRVARELAQATQFPPNVLECAPGTPQSSSLRNTVAAMGIPDPSALDMQVISGSTPKCSAAHILPVRPIPAWTSSSTRRIPCERHIRAISGRKALGGTMYPPSPCTGSKNRAATSSGGTRASR